MSEGLPQIKNIKRIAICLFTFVTHIYLLSLSLPNVYSVDQYHQRYEVTRSIVERFDLSIPEGYDGIEGIDGRTYSLYGLGWSILAVPFYTVGKFVGRSPENLLSILNPVAGAATVTLVFLFSIALGYSRRSSLAVAIFFGFGTFAWPLAKHPFDHVLETFFVLLSVYFMYLHVSKNGTKRLIISALCFGIAINIRLLSIMALPALLVLMGASCFTNCRFIKSSKVYLRNMVIFSVVLLPFAGLVLWYNYYRFGSIFETGFQLVAVRTGLDFFTGTPLLTGISGFLISPGKGFFYYSPISIFFFFTIIPFYKNHPWPAITFVLLIMTYLLFLSKNVYWHGDWAWGPRYLFPMTPLMIIPIAELLDSDMWLANRPGLTGLVSSVFAISLVIQVAAVSVHFYNYFIELPIHKTVPISTVRGVGVPTIYEPPPGIYFEWRRSPLLAQFRYVYKIGMGLWENKSMQVPEAKIEENTFKASSSVDKQVIHSEIGADSVKTEALPPFWIFDFWWVYLYFLYHNRTGFIVLLAFLVICMVYGYHMVKLSRR
jgi:hypothetical protein